MAAVTNFSVVAADGFPLGADPFGNNIAIRCLSCGFPVLAVALVNMRGMSEENPAECRGCKSKYRIEVRESLNQVVVHRVPRK